jgi:phosphoribosyl 1,2-cyclic phosphodiesterase
MNADDLNYIRFWGVRGSFPSPFGSHMRVGGNTSCVELRADGHILICDGGSGIIPFGNTLVAQSEIKELTIILTHYHWDHISGLPFFVPAFVPGWKINIFAPGDSKEEIERRISGQMVDPYFPVEVETWMADIHYLSAPNNQLEYGPFKIEAFNCYKSQVQKHPYPRNLKALKSLSIFRGTSCGFKNAEAFETLFSID